MKIWIVEALARYRSPSEVQSEVHSRFALHVSRQRVAAYDPRTIAGRRLSAALTAHFERTRRDFLDREISTAIEEGTARLRLLQRALDQALEAGEVRSAFKLLKVAYRLTGGH